MTAHAVMQGQKFDETKLHSATIHGTLTIIRIPRRSQGRRLPKTVGVVTRGSRRRKRREGGCGQKVPPPSARVQKMLLRY